MKIMNRKPFAAVVQAWLQAEWPLPKFDTISSQVPESFIYGEKVENQQDNQARFTLLWNEGERHVLLEPLLLFLSHIKWYSASYDREDIQRTFLVPSDDWSAISNQNYHPYYVLNNLHRDDIPTRCATRGVFFS